MRYDNISWVLLAPALASCACFVFEMFCKNFAESWNGSFEELRRGFEAVRGNAHREKKIAAFSHAVGTTPYSKAGVLVVDQKRTPSTTLELCSR
jgi:hypothetical protein